MEAMSDLLMYRTTVSEIRRGNNPDISIPAYSTTSVRSMKLQASEAAAPPAFEKPMLTSVKLLMAVLLNLVDCINMNILTPYAAEMVGDLLHRPVNDPEVLRNVGLLIGVYNISEMIFSPGWGRLSDRFGRRPVILASLGGAMLVPIAFGIAKSMSMALAVRALNGVLCGSIGITKTYVAEQVTKENEAWAFSILTTVYSVGMIVGPAMGGMLVTPAKWSPAAEQFFSQGVWKIFKVEPFLLPNLVFSLLAVTVWVLAFFFLEESLPASEREAIRQAQAAARALKLEAQSGKMEQGQVSQTRKAAYWDVLVSQFPFIAYPWRLHRAIASYGFAVGYVISTVQNIILLYQTPLSEGGFGLGPERLGMLQNFAALGLLVTQLCLYPKLVKLKGYRWCVVLGLSAVLLVTLPMPLYGLLHDPAQFGAWRMVPLVLMMVVQQAAFGFCTPTTTVWINRFAEGMDRGEVNGWANSFAALCRAIAPMAVGFLQGIGSSMKWQGGRYLALYVISLLAIAISVLLLPVLPKSKPAKNVTLKTAVVEDDCQSLESDASETQITSADNVRGDAGGHSRGQKEEKSPEDAKGVAAV